MVQTSSAQFADSIVSSKDLSGTGELLTSEALLIKKLSIYSEKCQDANLKCICDNAINLHRRHYDILLNYISSHNKQA